MARKQPPGQSKKRKSYSLDLSAGNSALTGSDIMSRKHVLSIGSQSPTPIFLDTFETANMLLTNDDGFNWKGNNNTSVVTMNADTAWCNNTTPTELDKSNKPYAVYNNGNICGLQGVQDLTSKNGNYSLRFRYAAGVNNAEQRFDTGTGYPELWVAYWERVPTNYSRGTSGSPTNNKFMWFQHDHIANYGGAGITSLEVRDWPNAGDATICDIDLSVKDGNTSTYHTSSKYTNFMTPSDAGEWMHIVYQLKSSSTPTAQDCAIRMYRRWADEQSYTLIAEVVNKAVAVTGEGGWFGGYLMGYANRPYSATTEFLIDDFALYSSDPR